MGTFLLFLIIIIITEILIFNCSTKQGKDTISVCLPRTRLCLSTKGGGVY